MLDIINDAEELIKLGYGTYKDIMNMTYRESLDIFTVRRENAQKASLKNVGLK